MQFLYIVSNVDSYLYNLILFFFCLIFLIKVYTCTKGKIVNFCTGIYPGYHHLDIEYFQQVTRAFVPPTSQCTVDSHYSKLVQNSFILRVYISFQFWEIFSSYLFMYCFFTIPSLCPESPLDKYYSFDLYLTPLFCFYLFVFLY